MASAKKGKKNKGKTLALIDFLQETPGSVQSVPIRKSTLNWADEVEDNHDVYDPRSNKSTSVVLPTAPKASRDFDDIIDKVPQDPPYIAYLSNLPYDVDEEEISLFFKNMKIANMRFPKDDRSGEGPKLKGFGYVEFEDRDSLLNALVMPDTTIKSRRIRIEVAGDFDNDKRRGGRMDMNRDRGNRPDISSGDWRSGPRSENTESDRRGGGGGGGFGRDRERERDRPDDNSMWRDGERRAPREPERNFTRSSDRFNRDERDSEFSRNRGEREDRSWNRDRDDRNWSRGGDRDRDRNRDDGFMSRRGPPTRRDPPPSGEDADPNSEPRRRQKLVLAPRTKPVEAAATEEPATSASIFGNAKPVDTSARERQIEERLAKAGDPLPHRDGSKDHREHPPHRERKEKNSGSEEPIEEKESVERTSSHPQNNDANGVVDKNHSDELENKEHENKEHEKKEYEKKEFEKKDANKADVGDKQKPDIKKPEKREKVEKEKEMPKVKQVDPPNFIANNKFAFLENEDTSD